MTAASFGMRASWQRCCSTQNGATSIRSSTALCWLAEAAHNAGIITNDEYAVFQNAGYKGLYDGLAVADIHQRKGLDESERILDFMGSTELIANLFRISQTEEKLRRIQDTADVGRIAAGILEWPIGKPRSPKEAYPIAVPIIATALANPRPH